MTLTYKQYLESIGEEGAEWLRPEQAERSEAREEQVFSLSKGSADDIKELIFQALERTEELNSFLLSCQSKTYAA